MNSLWKTVTTILLLVVFTNRQINIAQAKDDQKTTVENAKHAFEEALLHQQWQESNAPTVAIDSIVDDIEEEEAMIVKNLCVTATTHLRSSLRLTVDALRRISDTAAAIISGLAKAAAGAFKLSADGIWIIATRLAQPRAPDDRMPHFLDRMGRRVAKVMHTASNVLYGMSEACILTSETSEVFSSSLGQAVEDSFNGLEFLSYSLQQGLSLLLSTGGQKSRNYLQGRVNGQRRTDRKGQGSSIPLPKRKSLPRMTNDSSLGNDSLSSLHQTEENDDDRIDRMDEVESASLVSDPTDIISWKLESNELRPVHHQINNNTHNDSNSYGTPFRNEFSFWKDVLVLLRDVSREVSKIRSGFNLRRNLMDHYLDARSMIPLIVHVFWGWITGPWVVPIPFPALEQALHAIGDSSSSQQSSKPPLSKNSPVFSTSPGSKVSGTMWGKATGKDRKKEDVGSYAAPTMGPQLFLSLLLVAGASSMRYRSAWRRLTVLLILITTLWILLMAGDHIQRRRIALRSELYAVDQFVLDRVARAGAGKEVDFDFVRAVIDDMSYGDGSGRGVGVGGMRGMASSSSTSCHKKSEMTGECMEWDEGGNGNGGAGGSSGGGEHDSDVSGFTMLFRLAKGVLGRVQGKSLTGHGNVNGGGGAAGGVGNGNGGTASWLGNVMNSKRSSLGTLFDTLTEGSHGHHKGKHTGKKSKDDMQSSSSSWSTLSEREAQQWRKVWSDDATIPLPFETSIWLNVILSSLWSIPEDQDLATTSTSSSSSAGTSSSSRNAYAPTATSSSGSGGGYSPLEGSGGYYDLSSAAETSDSNTVTPHALTSTTLSSPSSSSSSSSSAEIYATTDYYSYHQTNDNDDNGSNVDTTDATTPTTSPSLPPTSTTTSSPSASIGSPIATTATSRRPSSHQGGLGSYISKSIEDLLATELALVPPGIANVQLKTFSLGSVAPVIKAVKAHAGRAPICTVRKEVGGGMGVGGCERLILDLDLTYASRDMDIVLTMRSPDVKSMLPEATVTLSGVVLSGVMRLDAALTPDYPFVGNATYKWMSLPTMDMTISSFGGLDLSSIPGVYTWMNITMTWLLGQYTDPLHGTIDLRHYFCPLCDAPPEPLLAPSEVWHETVRVLAVALADALQGAKTAVEGGAQWMKTKVQRGLDRVLDIAEEVGSLSQLGRMMMEDLKEEMMLLKAETMSSSSSSSSTSESSSLLSASSSPSPVASTTPASTIISSDDIIVPADADSDGLDETKAPTVKIAAQIDEHLEEGTPGIGRVPTI